MSMSTIQSAALPQQASLSLSTVETPSVVVDRGPLLANIARISAFTGPGLALRPHGKTHKSNDIARLQLEAGAVGLTCSKSEEAEAFLRGGVPRLTVAYPLVDPRKVARILDTATETGAKVDFVVDSPSGVETIEAVAAERGVDGVGLFVKVDVGLHRCGVDPDSEAGPELAGRITRSGRLRFRGLLSHAGQSYAARSRAAVREIAAHERAAMGRLRMACQRRGLDVPDISVGSTPTILAHDGFDGITEIRPGNYVFLDLTQVGIGVASLEEIALSVIATVVSGNDRYAIVDAGSKILSSDLGPHGSHVVEGHGLAFPLGQTATKATDGLPVTQLSEEHGFIEHGGRALPIGTRVRIFPNHACPVANLAGRLALCDGEEISTWLPTAGSGRVW